MKKLLVIASLAFLASCSQGVQGTWKLKNLYQNGKLSGTSDKAKQVKLIDSLLEVSKQYLPMMGMTEADFKKNVTKSMSNLDKSLVVITDNNFTMKPYNDPKDKKASKVKPDVMKCKIDQKASTITLTPKIPATAPKGSPEQKIVLKYKINSGVLEIRSKEIGMDLVQ